MIAKVNRLSRKALLLLFALSLVAAASAVAPPAMACDPEICPWSPPMHWDNGACACVCDCPDLWGNCGPCN
ncbi:MAG TPA: hypothetical protein VLX28_07550 [Thermoanaerobaculia bacterium]|nr:hypothetical protein [Thermoanaerobaculia bacterium]